MKKPMTKAQLAKVHPDSIYGYTYAQINYLEQAAKMIPWQVGIMEGAIYVPENEMDVAKENLTVQHLTSKVWQFVLQSEVHCETKEVFSPELRTRVFVQKEREADYIIPGQKVKDNRTHVVSECVSFDGDLVTLRPLETFHAKDVVISLKTFKHMVKEYIWKFI